MREGQRAGVEVPFCHSDGVPEAEQLCNEARSVGNTAWGTVGSKQQDAGPGKG